ncbi:NUDIX hydrolase family protein [Chitinibacter sp. GC72]|uniref:NUDIX hydrolase n=1 Tax=Chitinibacter sp. GC72 TaxID=1526917 RepID=UPI0012FABAC1|nr:DUF4743 domain-containing protein [Chitinibacter sp. GC72]
MSANPPLIASYLRSQPQFDSRHLLRLMVDQQQIGWLEPRIAQILQQFDARFAIAAHTITLQLPPHALQTLMNAAALHLRELGEIRVWRDELYAVHPHVECGAFGIDTANTLFTLERGAFRRFGLCSQAVHINGLTDRAGLPQIWLGQRAATKGIDPNCLDNLAAGGIPHNETPAQCVIRELAEEAGISQHIAQQAVYIEQIRSTRNEIDGTHDEILYCYDLQLPAEVIPRNTDGEVAAFHRVSVAECAARLPEMTWDAGLVTARLLARLAST